MADRVRILDPGLCKTCRHARLVVNDRGSAFWLCQASEFNRQMPKYPDLPVLACPEYRPNIEKKDPGLSRGPVPG